MFGVIDFTYSVSRRSPLTPLFLYPDLSSAISFFFNINQKKEDVSIQPNVNDSLPLLSSQNNIFNVSLDSLTSLHLPSTAVLNIAILRDSNYDCYLGSVLLDLSEEEIESLSSHYLLRHIVYKEEECGLCNSNFQIWDENENYGYEGSVYKPTYYRVVTLDDFEDHHLGWGSQDKIDAKIKKLNLDKSKIFFLCMRGGPWGLYLSKKPLPENLKHGSMVCWSCMDKIKDDFSFIWGH